MADANKAISLTITAIDNASTAIQNISNSISGLIASVKSAATQISGLAGATTALGKSATAAAKPVTTVGVESDKASKSVKDMGDKSKEAGKNLDDLEKTSGRATYSIASLMAQLTIVAVQLAAIYFPVKQAGEFEYMMAQVGAVGESSGDSLERLGNLAKEMGEKTVFSATEAAGGLKMLALAGLTYEQSMTALPIALDMAVAGMMDLEKAVTISTQVMYGFGLAISDLPHVADAITLVANKTNSSIEQLGLALSYVGPIASALGADFDEVTAALGILHNAGIESCYDPETEVLTLDGWKKWEDATASDIFATISPLNHALEYHPPLEMVAYHYTGKMFKIVNRGVDLLVTPNHNMYVKLRDHERYDLLRADHIVGKQVTFLTAPEIWEGEDVDTVTLPQFIQNRGKWDVEVPDLPLDAEVFMEFLGYYLSEGSHDFYKGTYRIQIHQTKPEGRDKIRKCLEKMPIKFKESDDRFTAYDQQLYKYVSQFGNFSTKYIPKDIKGYSTRLLSILYEALVVGDGGANGEYYTSSKRLKGDVEEICIKLGFGVSSCTRYEKGYQTIIDGRTMTASCDAYKINVRKNKVNPTYSPYDYKGKHGERLDGSVMSPFNGWVDYDGMVYCAEVPPNHVLIVRRNGKVVACGNTRAGTSLRMALSRLIEPSKEASGVMDELGRRIGQSSIQVFDAQGNFVGMQKLLQQLSDAGMTAGEAMTLFGERSGPAMTALVLQGVDSLEMLTLATKKANGATREIANLMKDTFVGASKELGASLSNLGIQVGNVLLPAMTDLFKEVTYGIRSLINFMELFPKTTTFVIELATALLSALTLLQGFSLAGKLFATMLLPLQSTIAAIKSMTLGMILFGSATTAVGAILTTTGIGILIAAVTYAVVKLVGITYDWITASERNKATLIAEKDALDALASKGERFAEQLSLLAKREEEGKDITAEKTDIIRQMNDAYELSNGTMQLSALTMQELIDKSKELAKEAAKNAMAKNAEQLSAAMEDLSEKALSASKHVRIMSNDSWDLDDSLRQLGVSFSKISKDGDLSELVKLMNDLGLEGTETGKQLNEFTLRAQSAKLSSKEYAEQLATIIGYAPKLSGALVEAYTKWIDKIDEVGKKSNLATQIQKQTDEIVGTLKKSEDDIDALKEAGVIKEEEANIRKLAAVKEYIEKRSKLDSGRLLKEEEDAKKSSEVIISLMRDAEGKIVGIKSNSADSRMKIEEATADRLKTITVTTGDEILTYEIDAAGKVVAVNQKKQSALNSIKDERALKAKIAQAEIISEEEKAAGVRIKIANQIGDEFVTISDDGLGHVLKKTIEVNNDIVTTTYDTSGKIIKISSNKKDAVVGLQNKESAELIESRRRQAELEYKILEQAEKEKKALREATVSYEKALSDRALQQLDIDTVEKLKFVTKGSAEEQKILADAGEKKLQIELDFLKKNADAQQASFTEIASKYEKDTAQYVAAQEKKLIADNAVTAKEQEIIAAKTEASNKATEESKKEADAIEAGRKALVSYVSSIIDWKNETINAAKSGSQSLEELNATYNKVADNMKTNASLASADWFGLRAFITAMDKDVLYSVTVASNAIKDLGGIAKDSFGVVLDIGNMSYDQAVAAVNGLIESYKGLYTELEKTRGSVEAIKTSITEWKDGFTDVESASAAFERNTANLGKAMNELRGDTSDVSSAYSEVVSSGSSAIDALKSQWDSLGGTIKGIEEMIKGIYDTTDEAILKIQQSMMTGPELLASNMEEFNKKIAEGSKLLNDGQVEAANAAFDAARQIAEATAKEVRGTNDEIIISQEQANKNAISMLKQIETAQVSGLQSFKGALESEQKSLAATIESVMTKLEDVLDRVLNSIGGRIKTSTEDLNKLMAKVNAYYGRPSDYKDPNLPKKATGGLLGGRPHSQGGTIIEAERGEYILPVKATKKIASEHGWGALEALRKGNLRKFGDGGLVTDDSALSLLDHFSREYASNRAFNATDSELDYFIDIQSKIKNKNITYEQAVDFRSFIKKAGLSWDAPQIDNLLNFYLENERNKKLSNLDLESFAEGGLIGGMRSAISNAMSGIRSFSTGGMVESIGSALNSASSSLSSSVSGGMSQLQSGVQSISKRVQVDFNIKGKTYSGIFAPDIADSFLSALEKEKALAI